MYCCDDKNVCYLWSVSYTAGEHGNLYDCVAIIHNSPAKKKTAQKNEPSFISQR